MRNPRNSAGWPSILLSEIARCRDSIKEPSSYLRAFHTTRYAKPSVAPLLRTFHRDPPVRTQPTTCGALVAILALSACGGNDPTTPNTGIVSALSGIYIVDLSSPNQGYTCQQVRVTLGQTPSWAVAVC